MTVQQGRNCADKSLMQVTPEGSQPHFVEPGVLARQGVRQHERPSKHPREVED